MVGHPRAPRQRVYRSGGRLMKGVYKGTESVPSYGVTELSQGGNHWRNFSLTSTVLAARASEGSCESAVSSWLRFRPAPKPVGTPKRMGPSDAPTCSITD